MTNPINEIIARKLLATVGRLVDLGHSKRDQAFIRQTKTLCTHPGGTAGGGATSPSDIISAFRFAANPGMSIDKLREARLSTTLSYARPGERVLMINDMSQLNYYRHSSKEDRRDIGDGKGKGYEYVCNLAVSLERECPIGVLHDCLISAGVFSVTLYRDAKRDKVYVKADNYVTLNVVVVKETCPKDRKEPIVWVLFTTLPVETLEQIALVVRIYELRWLIECFFKLLKSGFVHGPSHGGNAGGVVKMPVLQAYATLKMKPC